LVPQRPETFLETDRPEAIETDPGKLPCQTLSLSIPKNTMSACAV
jgi:hypothetical protein